MTAQHDPAWALDAPPTREQSLRERVERELAVRELAVRELARQEVGGAPRTPRSSRRGGRTTAARRAARHGRASAGAAAAPGDGGTPHRRGAAPSRRASSRGGSRRPGLLLGALVIGGLAAGTLIVPAAPDTAAAPTSVAAAHQALLAEDQALETKPQASITLAEAQARLAEVAASRSARAEAAAAAAEAEAAAAAAAAEAARPKTVLPVKGARLTSGYGARWGTFHYGIDLAAPMHTPEYAAADGVVLRAGSASGFGLAVYILHENGDVTVYGHMDKILVSPGDYVQAGETIALLGNRGQSTGPHLHFEVHEGGEDGPRINPLTWLRERGVDI